MNEWFSNATAYISEHWVGWLTQLAIGLVILLVGHLLARFASSATRRAITRANAAPLAPMLSTLVSLTVTVAAVVMALDQMGLDVTTVLAGAGVLGLAIGFGAQTLVKDCISGFFLVIEDVLEPGDWVDMDGRAGQVVNVGLRMTQLRAFDGTLWHVPNGEVKIVGNKTRGWMRAVASVGIAYEGDLAAGLRVLQAVGDRWAEENPDAVFEGDQPQAQGVVGLDDSSVGLRLVVKVKNTREGEVWPIERELRRRVKVAFDEEGIEIPFPRRVVYTRGEAA